MRISDWSSDVCSSDLTICPLAVRHPSLPLRIPLVIKFDPGLYIVAGPIGNLSDLTPRAAELLRNADIIAVEDSRVSAKLLRHAGSERPMVAYHDHSSEKLRTQLVERSEEHTSELQSLMRISYAVFCLKKNIKPKLKNHKYVYDENKHKLLIHTKQSNRDTK